MTTCCNGHHFEGCTDGAPGCCPDCPINPSPRVERAASVPVDLDDAAQVLADLCDVLHTGIVHKGGPCHGDNDGCEGGPGQLECELADSALDYVLDGFHLRIPTEGVEPAVGHGRTKFRVWEGWVWRPLRGNECMTGADAYPPDWHGEPGPGWRKVQPAKPAPAVSP